MSKTTRYLSLATMLLSLTSPASMGQTASVTRVAILMFDGVQIIDFAGPYEVFGHAGFEIYTVSPDGASVITEMNLSVNVDHDFASAPRADLLLIPGGNVRAAAQDARIREFVTRLSASADHVLSICTGSFILAGTGLLDGKKATTFHMAFDRMAAAFPNVEIVRTERWVDTGKLVTSAGLASGIDAALHVVAKIRGLAAARTVAQMLEYQWSPEQGFVRGLMADRHIRLPSAFMEPPQGTRYHPEYSFGDESSWEMAYHVESTLSPHAFIELLRERATLDAALEAGGTADPDRASWRYENDAGRWELSFAVAAIYDAESFRVVGKLVAVN